MNAWVRVPNYGCLIRLERTQEHIMVNSALTFDPNMVEEQPPPSLMPRNLNQNFYPPRSTNHSCFQTPDLGENEKFAFSPQYTTMLPKFSGEGDAYLFLSEFKEVCSMMQFPNVSQDVVK